jgi:hypothetical protein
MVAAFPFRFKFSGTSTPFICKLAVFYLVTNPKVPGSGSGFVRIRLKAGFGSGKILKFRDLPSTTTCSQAIMQPFPSASKRQIDRWEKEKEKEEEGSRCCAQLAEQRILGRERKIIFALDQWLPYILYKLQVFAFNKATSLCLKFLQKFMRLICQVTTLYIYWLNSEFLWFQGICQLCKKKPKKSNYFSLQIRHWSSGHPALVVCLPSKGPADNIENC